MQALPFALSFLFAAVPAQTTGAWRTDAEAARAEAAAQRKLLFVLVHRAGEPDAGKLLQSIGGNRSLDKTLRGCVPLLLCDGDGARVEADLKLFGVRDSAIALSAGARARRHFFGELPITCPRFLILHPEGDLLWQHAGVCGRSELAAGLTAARKVQRLKPERRLAVSSEAVVKAAASAANDEASYADVLFGVRFAAQDAHWTVLAPIAEQRELARRVLTDLRRMLGAERFAALARAAPASLQPLVEPLGTAPGSAGSLLGDHGPLGAPEELRWHGEERPLHRGKITVLWFCLTNDKTLPRQLIALRDAAAELGERIDVVALAASVDLEADLTRVGKLGFPVPAAVYRYDSGRAFAGVDLFPGAVVVDRGGTVVYRTADDRKAMRTSYTGFVDVVRALAARDG